VLRTPGCSQAPVASLFLHNELPELSGVVRQPSVPGCVLRGHTRIWRILLEFQEFPVSEEEETRRRGKEEVRHAVR